MNANLGFLNADINFHANLNENQTQQAISNSLITFMQSQEDMRKALYDKAGGIRPIFNSQAPNSGETATIHNHIGSEKNFKALTSTGM